jgi:bifunctional UDP-N-acetylglucosamine pyrophosphorylase/glucosamine-1-phosphate N-acetyltransferase
MSLEVIILAAGQGTRMRSALPKVLHPVGGKPMLQHVIDTAQLLEPARIHIVTGFESEQVRQTITASLKTDTNNINWCLQAQQNGTGHAVAQAIPAVAPDSSCLILYGDVPLVEVEILQKLCSFQACLSLITATPTDTTGLGRILRSESGAVTGIVEQKDATSEQLNISEVNTGIMLCQTAALTRWLNNLSNNNSQGEYYLTDIVASAVTDEESVHAEIAPDAEMFIGANSRMDLAIIERKYQQLQAQRLMAGGVTLADPSRLDVRGEVNIGIDCTIDINVVIEGKVVIGKNVSIGPNCNIRNAIIGDHCDIRANSVIDTATLGDHCQIGPFARLRPETKLANHVHIGNFVEIKKSEVGENSKANHLAYVGDSTVGKNVNIGAGVITCNYDGANKHNTIIGDDVFVGSDSQLVAPVSIASGATIGAGATITRNVDKNTLAISRAPQKSVANWKRPTKS